MLMPILSRRQLLPNPQSPRVTAGFPDSECECMKPALCSSTSGEAVKPDFASRAANTPDCAVRPACSDLVMVPKFATVPAASDAAIAIALVVSPALKRLSRAHAAAADSVPQIAVG